MPGGCAVGCISSPKGEPRPLGKVEIDCRKAAPKEEWVGRACESPSRGSANQHCLPKAARVAKSTGDHATQAAWEAARETPAGSPTGQDERERTRQRAGIAEEGGDFHVGGSEGSVDGGA